LFFSLEFALRAKLFKTIHDKVDYAASGAFDRKLFDPGVERTRVDANRPARAFLAELIPSETFFKFVNHGFSSLLQGYSRFLQLR
jgi:hypothetical protein